MTILTKANTKNDPRYDWDFIPKWREQEPRPTALSLMWNSTIPSIYSDMNNLARNVAEYEQEIKRLSDRYCEIWGVKNKSAFISKDRRDALCQGIMCKWGERDYTGVEIPCDCIKCETVSIRVNISKYRQELNKLRRDWLDITNKSVWQNLMKSLGDN